ncbi:hypothetical protein GCM10007854_09580 [Algimonas porphyrae]|uniref:Uncharacterized protein n=1 Tax=Algimonas porphyrae TaxID=1128113 RepID=A0ABQ5UZJ8_9PROT|nr:hypothetical protein GCM10007854_09580 [Algimonas porphyrae]
MRDRPSRARRKRQCVLKRHEAQAPAKLPDRLNITVSRLDRSLRVGIESVYPPTGRIGTDD